MKFSFVYLSPLVLVISLSASLCEAQDVNAESKIEKMELDNFEKEKDKALTRAIDLRSVIEETLRQNPQEIIRRNRNTLIEINQKNIFENFWLPTVTFDVEASNHKYDRVYTSSTMPQSTENAEAAPSGSYGVKIKEYTLFNWGRDYLDYQNQRHALVREKQRLTEQRRRLRFGAIIQYFTLIRTKEIALIKKEQLKQTSFIHRIAREKFQLRKIPSTEYYQTRAEYLRAQTEFQEAQFDVATEEEKMANILADEFKPGYRPSEQLKFTAVKTTADEALKSILERSPRYRDAKVNYEIAQRSYEKAVKDNLPLPKFTLDLGSYKRSFGPDGNPWLRETATGRNVEIVASLNLSWTLIGNGGLLNSRTNQSAYLQKRIAEIDYFNTKRELDVKVRTLLRILKFQEQKILIADYQIKNARSNFEANLDSYTAGRTSFPQIKLALDNWILSDINAETVKLEHLIKKCELADLMAMDDLPGDNFEELAEK
jgi:outer membrane protein TolC